ncbi:hypothetical protein YC2023_090535 [Brassica napus]
MALAHEHCQAPLSLTPHDVFIDPARPLMLIRANGSCLLRLTYSSLVKLILVNFTYSPVINAARKGSKMDHNFHQNISLCMEQKKISYLEATVCARPSCRSILNLVRISSTFSWLLW